MRRFAPVLFASLAISACCFGLGHDAGAAPPMAPAPMTPSAAPHPAPMRDDAPRSASSLPPEASPVLDAIARGGPFEHRQDGTTFQNRERRLPERPRGHYREYTVETPGSRDRGARRIVTGGDPPSEYFYTDDHYRTFRRLEAGEIHR